MAPKGRPATVLYRPRNLHKKHEIALNFPMLVIAL